tara:strand:- start:11265 stop:12065 length:801 start_codon:yes stop_codon:yes gene_type:complete
MTKSTKTLQRAKAGAMDAKAKGAQMASLKDLAPLAKEINTRMAKASKMEDDAYDHRLAAAITLAAAETIAIKGKLKFKEWVTTNIDQSYETARKLVAIGKSKNPAEALEEMRVKNKLANAALRERKAVSAPKDPVSKKAPAVKGKTGPVQTPAIRAMQALDAMPDDQAATLIRSQAENYGMKTVPASVVYSPMAQVKAIMGAANLEEQMEIFSWMKTWDNERTRKIDAAEFDSNNVPFFTAEQLTDIPPSLDRRLKVTKKSRRRTA